MCIGKKVLCLLLCLLLIYMGPGRAEASSLTPEAELQKALGSLNRHYTQVINDPDYDLEKLKASLDFTGVLKWSYTGERNSTQTKLNWEFIYYDSHALIMAQNDPNLIKMLTPQQQNLLTACQQIIASLITPEMSDFQKEKAIHDYLVRHSQYDSKTADTKNTSDITPFTAYGLLMNGKAVCQGYAEAASILLWMAGIENYRLESPDHTWNLVNIGGDFYHLDVTMDDPVGAAPNEVRYDYFNLTDAQIERRPMHDWKDREKYPKAVTDEQNYFRVQGLYAENYQQLVEKVTGAFLNGQTEITLWLGDIHTRPYNWQQDLQFVFGLKSGDRRVENFTYVAPDETRDTLTIYFV